MGNGALPNGPSCRAHPQLYHAISTCRTGRGKGQKSADQAYPRPQGVMFEARRTSGQRHIYAAGAFAAPPSAQLRLPESL